MLKIKPKEIQAEADPTGGPLKFALVIPALNEEEAIDQTLENALNSREEILKSTAVDEMRILFVNDGSTDNTQAIADRYDEVEKISLYKNMGYGYAIQQGFLATDAQLVGFMDADGTCNAASFIGLINLLLQTDSDIVLGSRINPESQMPRVRRWGNRIFSRLIGWVSGQNLSDPASGIRVIRRERLKRMMPLPTGLHFTPAMSAIAVLNPNLAISEIPVPYCERVGKSKLSVLKDGIRFIWSILFASLCYNPLRLSISLAVLALLAGAGIGSVLLSTPLDLLLTGIVLGLFIFLAFLAVSMGVLAHQINYLLIESREIPGKLPGLLRWLSDGKWLLAVGALCWLGSAGGALVALLTSFFNRIVWLVFLAFFLLGGWMLFVGVLFRIIWAVRQRRDAEHNDPFDRKNRREAQ